MRRLFVFALWALSVAAPAYAAPAPVESWGKAGVSLAQYREDALQCGLQGHYTDISKTDDAKAFVTASRELDTVTNGASAPNVTGANGSGPQSTDAVDQMVQYANQQQHIVDSVHAEQRFHNIKRTLLARDEQCLNQRGYSKFRLSDEQRHQLRKLKIGSDERRAYLYRLASDPAVLQAQRVVVKP
jgi:hypothetical protein